MAAKQASRGRSPLVPISVNAFLGHAFNACVEPLDLDVQELDPGLLRFTRSFGMRTGTENVLSPALGTNYYSNVVQSQNALRNAVCSCSPIIVSRWSPEPVIPLSGHITSSFNSPENLESAFGSLSPSSCFSAFRTPIKTPRLKIPTFNPAQLEEDVLVMDGIVINGSSFITPEQSCLKHRFTSSTDSSSSTTSNVSPNSLYKTEICRSWEESGTCRYGLKCQFAHGKDDLRPATRHPKYKTEICRAFTATGTCPYGTRCRFIHRLNSTDGNELNLPVDLDEILNATNSSLCESGNRTVGRRLPIFRQICPLSPDSN